VDAHSVNGTTGTQPAPGPRGRLVEDVAPPVLSMESREAAARHLASIP
jgi:hypothetical protein